MAKRKLPKPTDGELAILGVLWRHGPRTVREIHSEFNQTRETGYTTVLKMLQIMAEKGLVTRETMSLEMSDLREQMSRKTYWSQRNGGDGKMKQRFGSGAPMCCWAIEVDEMNEFGYRQISDEDYLKSKLSEKQPSLVTNVHAPSGEWMDPRKGDIFSIIEMVEKES